MVRLPIDTSRLQFLVVAAAEPLRKYEDGKPRESWAPRVDENGYGLRVPGSQPSLSPGPCARTARQGAPRRAVGAARAWACERGASWRPGASRQGPEGQRERSPAGVHPSPRRKPP